MSETIDLDPDSDAYYAQVGTDLFRPTLHVQGAWQAHEQHMAPVAGLLTHCLERFNPREDTQLARVCFDILGLIPAADSRVRCRTLRPGRTIELDEAELSVGGRTVVRATAWRLARTDTAEVAGHEAEPMPAPADLPSWEGTRRWSGGFIASLEFRAQAPGTPGRGRVWVRPTKRLVEGVEDSPLARFVGVVDTANGVATRVEPTHWMYPNTDLTIHLFRTPGTGWVGLDTRVAFGDSGVGLTSAVLHDAAGAVGRAAQILTVRPIPHTASTG